MGTCKCNEVTSIFRSDLFVPNLDIEPKQVHPKKLMRLQTIYDNNPDRADSPVKGSTEKFIREKASLYKTVVNKKNLFDKPNLRLQSHHTQIENGRMSKKNLNEVIDNEGNIQCDFTEKHYSTKEEKMIIDILLHHFFFYKATSEIMNYILDEINEFQINSNASLFTENEEGSCMYIIKSGQVELYHTNNQLKEVMSTGGIFGELAIVNSNTKRKYSVRTLSELYCYMIEESSFLTVSEKLLGQRAYQFPFFNHIDTTYKENLELFVIELDFKKGHSINDIKEIFGVVEGKLKVIDKSGNFVSFVNSNEIYGMSKLLVPDTKDSNNDKIIVEEPSKCFVLPFKAFIEVFGLNYQYEILFSYFKCSMSKNPFFSQLCNEENFSGLFSLFNIVEYLNGQIVYSCSSERKVMLLIDGEGDLIFLNSKKKALCLGQVFGEEIINEDEYVDDIVSNKTTLIFECEWQTFCTKATINNIQYNELMNTMKHMYLINSFKEKQLVKLGMLMNRATFKKGEIIIKAGEPADKLYLIQKGIVKQIYNEKVVRYYNSNNSFGEIYLLNDKEDNSEVIASSKDVYLYYYTKDIFYNLLGHSYINSMIKIKLFNENTEIFLLDLFNISTLHKGKRSNVYIVHNKISIYAIKAVPLSEKDKQNIPNIINEKKISIRLDHPFVIQYTKTLKSNSWCFFLSEYIHGITIEEYLEMCNPYQDKYHINFYGGSLFLILDYFKTIGVIHRDIVLSNIIIETSGYIKLLDFSSSKTIKNNITKTIIGTPLFTAPEVLAGKGYSYSCDYWSVGVCLYFIYYGYYPFGAKAKIPGDVYKEILNKKLNFKKESEEDEDIQELLTMILNKNPNERCIELSKIKKTLLFQDFNWEMLIRRKLNPPFLPQVVKFTYEKMLQNVSNPFRVLLDNEKITDNDNQSIRLNKDVVLGTNNDERNVDPNWFNDF